MDHKKQREQCVGYDLHRACDAETKLEAIVELLENITVFNVGDGLDNFAGALTRRRKTVVERFDTFAKLFEKKNGKTSRTATGRRPDQRGTGEGN
jgi:hypothetical protein